MVMGKQGHSGEESLTGCICIEESILVEEGGRYVGCTKRQDGKRKGGQVGGGFSSSERKESNLEAGAIP